MKFNEIYDLSDKKDIFPDRVKVMNDLFSLEPSFHFQVLFLIVS